MPTNAYRSSGRPEVTYAIERLIDTAARERGFDRVELRRKNLIDRQMMPYGNAVGAKCDSGDQANGQGHETQLCAGRLGLARRPGRQHRSRHRRHRPRLPRRWLAFQPVEAPRREVVH
jgi:carbon-monoxide dehydrogenase large subunit